MLYDWLCLTVVWFLWCPIPYVLVVVWCLPDLVCYADDPTSRVRLVWFLPHCCMSGLRDVNSMCDVRFHVWCLIPCAMSDSMCAVRFHVCCLIPCVMSDSMCDVRFHVWCPIPCVLTVWLWHDHLMFYQWCVSLDLACLLHRPFVIILVLVLCFQVSCVECRSGSGVTLGKL